MIKYYLVSAYRNLINNKLYSFINIFGLSIGLACCFIIFSYLREESIYDTHYKKADRIYRIVENSSTDLGVSAKANTYAALLPLLKEKNYTGVAKYLRLYFTSGEFRLRKENKNYIENNVVFSDSTYFSFFDYSWLVGNPDEALKLPFSIVLKEELAIKYFGHTNVIGEVLEFVDEKKIYNYTISGVVKDSSENSHFDFDFLLSMSSLQTSMPWFENWGYPPVYTYVLLKEGYSQSRFKLNLENFQKELPQIVEEKRTFDLQPLTDIHLYSQRENEIQINGNITYVRIFGVICIFILLIACINFMNLATASSRKRAKEIGILKVTGMSKKKLIFQFLVESILYTIIALILSLFLIKISLPYFNSILGKELSIQYLNQSSSILLVLLLIFVVSLLAGGYPALFLSSFKPISVLKGLSSGNENITLKLRHGLVFFQFFLSSILIIVVITMKWQLDYLQNKNPGFNKNNIVTVSLRDQKDQINHKSLKKLWLQHPNVVSVSSSSGVPTSKGIYDFIIKPKNTIHDSLIIETLTVDHDFIKTYELQLLSGRDFSRDYPTDALSGFILNKSAVKKIGWSDPIGKELSMDYYRSKDKIGNVIGVIEDFNYYSLHKTVNPLILHIMENSYYNDYISVKMKPDDISKTLAFLENEWRKFNPDRVFDFTFLDQRLNNLYKSEISLSQFFLIFAILAIFIACLGLLGLCSFTVEQRTKEIGIRKVIGFSTNQLMILISVQFFKIISLAFILSLPISFWIISEWLSQFAYKITGISIIFIISGLCTFTIVLLTVSIQIFSISRVNPISALRNE